MTKPLKIITVFSVSLLLISCSSGSNTLKFSSKEEAFLAQVDFLKDSEDIVVMGVQHAFSTRRKWRFVERVLRRKMVDLCAAF